MRNLHFHYLKAQNFLCYGEEGIEANLDRYGNIVLIQGENLDALKRRIDELALPELANEPSNLPDAQDDNNGIGKSSVAEIIVYTLFGKPIQRPKRNQDEVVNNIAGRKLWTEVRFDKYRIVRQRTPDKLQVWESKEGIWDKNTEISKGGIPATQKLVEDLIGVSYESFCTMSVFTDDNTGSFLDCDGPTKRKIVENLLGLERYRTYHDNARELHKRCKEKIKMFVREYELLMKAADSAENHVKQVEKQEVDWKSAKAEEFKKLMGLVKQRQDALSQSSDIGAALTKYAEAQDEMARLRDELPDTETKRKAVADMLLEVTAKMDDATEMLQKHYKKKAELDGRIANHETEIMRHQKTMLQLEQKTGEIDCPYCYGKIDKKNFKHVVEEAEKAIAEQEEAKTGLEAEAKAIQAKLDKVAAIKNQGLTLIHTKRTELATLDQSISNRNNRIAELSKVKEPKAGVDELLIQEQIDDLRNQAAEKQKEMEGPSPFVGIVESARKELSDKRAEAGHKKAECDQAEEDLPYYNYWVKAFSETGIRKYIIDGIIPALNARIAFWLQFLADNKIKLTFDKEFKETIDRYPFEGRPYVYHRMSGGQRRRLILALSQAFAYIRTLNAGACPSCVFLDEVTMNMDRAGIEGIYRMICELSKERQVFVIDHSPALTQMLDGCEKIYLQMKDGVTKLIKQ
jgi:DNA repair exonuclease SbcCD ATPase subunit